jgi:hypothetical protein
VVYVSPRPDDTSYEGAAVLAFALSTAAMGLFHENMLGPAQPPLEGDRLELVGLGKIVLALTMQCSTVIRLTAIGLESQGFVSIRFRQLQSVGSK